MAEKTTPKKTEPETTDISVSRPKAPRSGTHVIGSDETDTISIKGAVYKNRYARKSLTVHHIQRRLWDWGFREASADVDGYYGDLTKSAVEKFQEHVGLEVTGLMDKETFKRLFENDKNVTLVFI